MPNSFLALVACGQFVPAGSTVGANVSADVNLVTREELASATTLLHYGQSALLAEHTGEDAHAGGQVRLVDYSAMLASPEARVVLSDALANLASVDPTALATHDEQLAFWIDAYNGWVIQEVLERLEDDPDWDGPMSGAFVMFSTAFVVVGGYELTLNQVEHGVIRGDEWSLENYFEGDAQLRSQAEAWHEALWEGSDPDARVHMGLNCASLSCPDIGNRAFRAATLSADLDAAATRFLDHPGKGAGPDGVSELFSWFPGDFERTFGSVEEFVATYRTDGTDGVDFDTTIPYDWTLNAL